MLFQNISSFEDLKKQYRQLAMQHHPDKGGNLEIMQQLNNEFDMLFKVWKIKDKTNINTAETAQSFTSEFYTRNGWKGENYNLYLSTKEITKILRDAIKVMYPLCKFSVSFDSYSGGSSINIALMQAPYDVFLNDEVITRHYMDGTSKIEKHIQLNQYYISKDDRITEQCKSMMEDINSLICSYRYDDSDGMIDYFDTNFYYHLNIGKWNKDFEVVEKTARIGCKPNCENKGLTVAKQQTQHPENMSYEYTITQDEDTRDNSTIYIVKFAAKLSKEEYIELNKKIKSIGGYYSKFKHGFLFKSEPSEVLCSLFGNCDINEQNNDNTITQETKTAEQEATNKQKTIDKINKQIESAQQKINALSGDYKCNTYKRMNEQAGREQKINGFRIDIEILEYLLDIISERSLTIFESALINGVFRDEIHAYYLRHEAFNKPNRVTSAQEIKFPEIDKQFNSWWNKEVPTKQKRLAKAGIFNTVDLIKAAEQYKTIFESVHEHASPKQQRIKKMEREARINQKGDINFTPSEVAKRLVEYAHISANSRVLEPSAGIGNIADEINRITQNIDVCEQRYDFVELLKLKGYNVVENDFLSYNTNEKYDAIIMNPPFSDEQNHIKHAYSMLKSGGILVSITSPHWTFASDRSSQDFKSWVENENSFTFDLASGTFEKTGVASKILVIEKLLEDEQISA